MGRQVFTAGEILTAANMNDLSDQSVMVFDDATARTTAIPTPVEGMVTYLKDSNLVQAFTGSAFTAVGGILQVVSTTLTTPFTASLAQGAETEITGLTATITPSSDSSKILVQATITASRPGVASVSTFFSMFRGVTKIALGDSVGVRQTVTSGIGSPGGQGLATASLLFLDSPNTTSATTYSVKVSHGRGETGTVIINRTTEDSNNSFAVRSVSTITVMEVAG